MADLATLLLTDVQRPAGASDEDYDRLLNGFVQELRRSFSVKSATSIGNADVLHTLHPKTHTISYAFLLNNLDIVHTNDTFLLSLVAFCNQFDPVQARYIGPEWRRVLDIVQEVVLSVGMTDLLVALRTAILRMDPTSSTLTSAHLHLLDLCLMARRPREALPILDKDIMALPYSEAKDIERRPLCSASMQSSEYISKESGISGELSLLQVQEYYLIGATVYIGLRQYSRARLFLELVLATPSLGNAVDMYMLEAHKKLILVNLVLNSHVAAAGQTTDQGVTRIVQPLAKAYDALTEAYKARDLNKFHAEVDVAGNLWHDDANFGLVQEAAEALRRQRVLDLQSTYAALPVDLVAAHLSMPAHSTVGLLRAMIDQGYLRATLVNETTSDDLSATPTVVFLDNRNTGTSEFPRNGHSSDGRIKSQISRIDQLASAVAEADRKLSLTKEYGDWQRRHVKGSGHGGGGGNMGAAAFEDPMEMDFQPLGQSGSPVNGRLGDDGGDDEDIMAL